MSRSPIPACDSVAFAAHMREAEARPCSEPEHYWLMLDAAEEFMLARRYQYGNPLDALKQFRGMQAGTSAPGVDIDAVHRNPRWQTKERT